MKVKELRQIVIDLEDIYKHLESNKDKYDEYKKVLEEFLPKLNEGNKELKNDVEEIIKYYNASDDEDEVNLTGKYRELFESMKGEASLYKLIFKKLF